MKIWVNGRKLKCKENGCKKKHAYTLEYTKHRDGHTYAGLQCAICNRPQPSPADYATHMAGEHPNELSLQVRSIRLRSDSKFQQQLQETQPEDLAPPPAPPTFPAAPTSTPSPNPVSTETGGQVGWKPRSFNFSGEDAVLLLWKFLILFSDQVCSPAMFHQPSSQEGFQQVKQE